MSDLKQVDISRSIEPSEQLSLHDRFRFQEAERNIQPLIDPTKPMVYVAAGYDMGTVLGSGVERATLVDPVYSKKNASKYSGLTPLIDIVTKFDSRAVVEASGLREGPVVGELSFDFEGKKRSVTAIGKSASGYQESGKHSAFVSIGHGTPELFLPACDAEVYAISHISPEAWGYKDIVHPFRGELGIPIAKNYQSIGLSAQEMTILASLNISRLFDSIRDHIEGGESEQLKPIFSRLVQEEVTANASFDEVIGKHFEKRFEVLSQLNPDSRQFYIKDVSAYIQSIFSDSRLPHAYATAESLLDALAKNR